MKKILFITILSWSMISLLKAQYPYVTQYSKNYFLVNPAAAGLDSSSQMVIWNRNNYSGSQRVAFSSLQMAFATPIQDYNAALTVKLSYDASFYFRNVTSLSGAYVYTFPFTENTDVRVAMGIGIHRISDSLYTGTLSGQLVNYLPFYDFGMLFNLEHFVFGMSAFSANSPRSRDPLRSVYVNRVISVMAKYKYQYSDLILLMPSIFIRNDGYRGSISLEAKAEAELWDTFLLGVGYRFTRFGQLQINPPYGYPVIRLPDYITIEAGGYFSDLMYFVISYDAPVNTNVYGAPSLIEGTIGLGL